MTWGASLSWLWGNTAHSDLQLQLCTTQPAASADEEAANSSRSCEAVDSQGTAKVARTTGRNATAPESARAAQTSGTSYARTFRLHANILGSCSSYFQKRTTPQGDSSAALQYADAPAGAEQGCGGDGAQPRLLLLVEHVEDGEVDAAEAVLRHCYTAQLCAEGGDAAQLSVASLLQMMVLADRFDVSPCLSHCGEELAKRGAAAYDVATLNTVFNGLPPAFQGLPYHAAAVSSATERLLQLLGNAEAVGDGWTDPDSTLGQHLLQLCHPAMLALVGSSGLKTRSENSVLMMADAWVSSSSAGAACSEAQLRQLVDVISMGHLTHTFQFDLLPKLAWVKLASDEERSLARFAAADADRRASLVEHGGLAGPDAWYVRARDPWQGGVSKVHSWEVSRADLQSTLAEVRAEAEVAEAEATDSVRVGASRLLFYNGFFVEASLDIVPSELCVKVFLCRRVTASDEVGQEALSKGERVLWLPLPYQNVHVSARVSCWDNALAEHTVHNSLSGVLEGGVSYTTPALVKVPALQLLEIGAWEPYLQGDKVQMQVSILRCD